MSQPRTALITGSTDGLGRMVAQRLAATGVTVLVHGRNRQRGEQLVSEIVARGGAAKFYQADFLSLAAVRALADTIQREQQNLPLLINNAGLGTGGRGTTRQTSVDGYESRFAVNYLAGFLLTRLLLPLIQRSAPARIVNVASVGQYPLDFDNLMLTRAYSGVRAYAQSKLAQILFTLSLARELEGTGVTVNCLHPATYMNTTMVRDAGVTPVSSIEQGAEAVMRLAASADVASQSGMYFDGHQPAQAHAQAYDLATQQRLQDVSLRLTGLSA